MECNEGQYGVLKLETSPPGTAAGSSGLSFANPAYEPSATAPTYKVEDIVIRGNTTSKPGGFRSKYFYLKNKVLEYFTPDSLFAIFFEEIILCEDFGSTASISDSNIIVLCGRACNS